MATNTEILTIFDELQTMFFNFKPKDAGRMIDLYQKYLAQYPLPALEHAVGEYVKVGKFFPAVAEIVQLAEAYQPLERTIQVANTKDLDLRWIQLKRDYAAGVFNPAEWERLAEGFDFIGFETTAASVRARMAAHELEAVPA